MFSNFSPMPQNVSYLLINAFIQPHYGSELLWTVFDGDEDFLGSEIHPGYRKACHCWCDCWTGKCVRPERDSRGGR